MANIDNILDGGSGALGGLVFYKMNGKSYVRTKPSQYNDKKSQAQLAQRQRMLVVNEFLKPFSPILRITFASEAQGRSALQAAQSYNMRNAIEGVYPEIKINKSNVLLSKGSLPLPQSAGIKVVEDGVQFYWSNGEECTGSRTTDTLVVIALPSEGNQAVVHFTAVPRSLGECIIDNGILPGGDYWIAFRNIKETELSDSLYVGLT